MRRPPRRSSPLWLAAGVWLAAGACGEVDPEGVQPAADPAPDLGSETAFHERALVFMSTEADTAVVMPWLFRATEYPGAVVRDQGLWISRAGAWELLARDTATTPETRSAWRILPTGRIRLAVGRDEAVEALRFGTMEVRPGEFLAGWSGRDTDVRLYAAGSTLPPAELEGLLVDRRRSSRADDPPRGGWILLHAGASAQLLLEEAGPVGDETDGTPFDGWSRIAFQERAWPGLSVRWEEVRAFEEARRDIPVAWSIASQGGEIDGEIRSIGSYLAAGKGPGPLLPVDAFFEVEGTLRVLGESFEVRGVVRHAQP